MTAGTSISGVPVAPKVSYLARNEVKVRLALFQAYARPTVQCWRARTLRCVASVVLDSTAKPPKVSERPPTEAAATLAGLPCPSQPFHVNRSSYCATHASRPAVSRWPPARRPVPGATLRSLQLRPISWPSVTHNAQQLLVLLPPSTRAATPRADHGSRRRGPSLAPCVTGAAAVGQPCAVATVSAPLSREDRNRLREGKCSRSPPS